MGAGLSRAVLSSYLAAQSSLLGAGLTLDEHFFDMELGTVDFTENTNRSSNHTIDERFNNASLNQPYMTCRPLYANAGGKFDDTCNKYPCSLFDDSYQCITMYRMSYYSAPSAPSNVKHTEWLGQLADDHQKLVLFNCCLQRAQWNSHMDKGILGTKLYKAFPNHKWQFQGMNDIDRHLKDNDNRLYQPIKQQIETGPKQMNFKSMPRDVDFALVWEVGNQNKCFTLASTEEAADDKEVKHWSQVFNRKLNCPVVQGGGNCKFVEVTCPA